VDPARAYLLAMVKQNRVTLASLSRALGRNHAYLHQFVHRGTPKHLPERVRRELAGLLGMPEATLIAPEKASVSRAANAKVLANAPDSFPARLAMARAQSNYPRPSAFAKAAEIDQTRYSALEEGEVEPSLDELDRLSQTSGKTLDWLIRGVGETDGKIMPKDGKGDAAASQTD